MDEATERRAVFSDELHGSSAQFSHAVPVGGPGSVSGTIGQHPDDGALIPAQVTTQRQAMSDDVDVLLRETDLDLRDLGRTTPNLTGCCLTAPGDARPDVELRHVARIRPDLHP